RNRAFNVYRILYPHLLEIEEEERTILDYGAAQREAVLVAHVIGLFSAVEIVTRVKSCSLAVPPTAAVEFVGALLQHNIDHGSTVVAELCGEAVILHLEFLNDLHGRLVIDVGVATLTLLRRA